MLDVLYYSVAYYIGYDVVFTAGHWCPHRIPVLYKFSHRQHHTTFADSAVSRHFMNFSDFSLLPVALPVFLFGLHVPTLYAGVVVGSVNSAVVHSSVDLFPWLPSPRHHLQHHQVGGGHTNLGLGLVDRLCGTRAPC